MCRNSRCRKGLSALSQIDRELRRRVESILDRILAAQQDDGFPISCYIVENQDQRWEGLRLEHQLYHAGHFFEMAVAHRQLTGQPKAPTTTNLSKLNSMGFRPTGPLSRDGYPPNRARLASGCWSGSPGQA